MIKTTIATMIPITAVLSMFANIFAQSVSEHGDASINDLKEMAFQAALLKRLEV